MTRNTKYCSCFSLIIGSQKWIVPWLNHQWVQMILFLCVLHCNSFPRLWVRLRAPSVIVYSFTDANITCHMIPRDSRDCWLVYFPIRYVYNRWRYCCVPKHFLENKMELLMKIFLFETLELLALDKSEIRTRINCISV